MKRSGAGINKDPDVCWNRLRMARNVMGWSPDQSRVSKSSGFTQVRALN